jgi:transcriptional regulator with XRE-family HTH domain
MKSSKQILGDNIRLARQLKGLSQEELAELACLHRTYIGSVERGERNVSLENIVSISRALQLHPTNLLEGIE